MNCIDCRYSLLKDGHYNCTYEEGECIKISVLEKENAELERKLEQTEKDLADYQFNYPTIKELQKENAELKEKYKWLGSSTKCWFRNAPCRSCDEHDERLKLLGLCYIGQLDKAKELIKSLVDDLEIIDGEQTRKLKSVKEAEQFLKEE